MIVYKVGENIELSENHTLRSEVKNSFHLRLFWLWPQQNIKRKVLFKLFTYERNFKAHFKRQIINSSDRAYDFHFFIEDDDDIK